MFSSAILSRLGSPWSICLQKNELESEWCFFYYLGPDLLFDQGSVRIRIQIPNSNNEIRMFLQVALSPGFETFMNFRSDGPEIYLSMDSLGKETLVKLNKIVPLKIQL